MRARHSSTGTDAFDAVEMTFLTLYALSTTTTTTTTALMELHIANDPTTGALHALQLSQIFLNHSQLSEATIQNLWIPLWPATDMMHTSHNKTT